MTPNERLRQLRLSLNKSQKSMGQLLGIMQDSYTDIERGNVNVSPTVLKKLDKLGFNPDYIMTGKGGMKKTYENAIVSRFLKTLSVLGYDEDLIALADKMGLDVGDLSFVLEGKKPDAKFIRTYLKAFPQLNREWLMDNRGAMFSIDIQQYQQQSEEISMLRGLLAEKNGIIADKDKTIHGLYKQIDLLQSFIPDKGG